MRACDVCILIRGEFGAREVQYCKLCDAYLCDVCRARYDLRAIAAIRRTAQEAIASIGMTGRA